MQFKCVFGVFFEETRKATTRQMNALDVRLLKNFGEELGSPKQAPYVNRMGNVQNLL
jgi:hypothetical protein